MSSVADFWDQRFTGAKLVYGAEPNAFLVRQRHRLEPGMAVLAPGDGEGRNGVWLAQQGMRVTSVDASAVGLAKALRLALDRGVSLKTECADLTTWDWPQGRFDAAVLFYLHLPPEARRMVHGRLADSLKPGGWLILEAFHPDQTIHRTGGPGDPAMLYDLATLRQDFAALKEVEAEEALIELDAGHAHSGQGAVTRFVARRA
ncbi:SAM-dependent methyltransferase [Roseospirillum parvum]|uniref:Methyltransferase domain-containing protein n=1 Tax=Roseospirillum parvum TaxID=83401 RepID=A0A1G8A038_9PROT|nr:class I SAM-dependent methyltransferase [Roseospirillum parvum]SDH14263.1 Methyltransferase domain-containing protein [Roseospirillum parvum]